MATTPTYTYALGKRKTAVAQVRLFFGTGASTINGRALNEYIHRPDLFDVVYSPLKTIGAMDAYYFEVIVRGSGESAQAQAIAHGISRALVGHESSLRKVLKGQGLLRRDARKVERKKPGLHKARKASQWSKR